MKSIVPIFVLAAILCGILLHGGCDSPISLPQATNATNTIGDTNYAEIFPPWGGFADPRTILMGRDQLIYVADYAGNRVLMMDASGAVLRQRTILHPISLAQNSKLDLYVGGEAIAPNGVDTAGAIFRIALVRLDTVYLAGYHIDTLLNDTTPIYRDTAYYAYNDLDTAHMKIVWEEPGRPQRRYPGIGILPGNGYLAARTGPDNSSFVDPDTRVLVFDSGDTLITPLGDLVTRASGGTAITDIRFLTGLLVLPASSDFVLTQSSDGVAYGAIWMMYVNRPDFQGYMPKYDPTNPTQAGVDFLHANQFDEAMGAAFDARRRDLFIVDAGLDSVLKFDRNGQFKTESFGKYKTTSIQFPGLNRPSGIGFSSDCTLYVVDSGNKVIRRFKLSTQTLCN